MTKSIWKFPVAIVNQQLVEMPLGAKILTTAMQGETPCLWAEVDPEETGKHLRNIHIFGTGQWMPADPSIYIGSLMLHGGALVFHVYDAGAISHG